MVPKEVEEWCKRNGWTEPVFKLGQYYAFPPNAGIEQPVPTWWNAPDWLFLYNYYQQILKPAYFLLIPYPALLLCMFLWQWSGIWSIYLSQVENQKFLACHYCPVAPGVLVEMKDPSQGLQEVQGITISKPEKLRFTKNMAKLVSREEVKGRVLYFFSSERARN